ncbi:MAG: permease [Synergistaceae bacterium]|nr:permease [Synergistaceae bacterium]
MKQEIIYLSYYFITLFKEIAPFWALGILVGSVISVFAKERIHGLLGAMQGARFGAFGVIPASILGIISPLCMYGTIPIAASLSEKGLKDDWLAAFMMSSILLNPQLIIYSAVLGRGAGRSPSGRSPPSSAERRRGSA